MTASFRVQPSRNNRGRPKLLGVSRAARARRHWSVTRAAARLALAVTLLAGSIIASTPSLAQDVFDVRRAAALHGAWPAPWQPDPTNSVSGNADAVALGRLLFFDARLSPSGRVACSSCHRPERGWTDGRAKGRGLGQGARNTPSLYDVRFSARFGWRGERDSLWQQSMRPILDPLEMGSSAAHVRAHIAANPALASLHAKVFGGDAGFRPAEDALADAAKALAAYQETITGGTAPFDRWRDALARGEEATTNDFASAARQGFAVFAGAARCSSCHSGPTFSDGRLHDVTGSGTAYRTPTLRNLARTGPYLHDGSRRTLAGAIRAHRGGPRLDAAQLADVVAFLRTLSP